MEANEVPDPNKAEPQVRDASIYHIEPNASTECDTQFSTPAPTELCGYDVHITPGVIDTWNIGNKKEASAEAQVIAAEHGEWSSIWLEAKPRPTNAPTIAWP